MNIFLSFKNTFLLFNVFFTPFLACWAYKTPVPTPIKQNGNVRCNSLHIYAHICAYAYTYICAHLEALSSRCICPFLMRVFKSRHRPLFCPFANQQLNRAQFSLRKMVKDTVARFGVQISIQFSALYPVDSLQANLISYLSCSRDENAKYTLEFSFQICRTPCTHCTLERHGKQNCPPQLWFMLWIMQNYTMSAIKNAFQLFPASISDPENIDTYQISRALPKNSLFFLEKKFICKQEIC